MSKKGMVIDVIKEKENWVVYFVTSWRDDDGDMLKRRTRLATLHNKEAALAYAKGVTKSALLLEGESIDEVLADNSLTNAERAERLGITETSVQTIYHLPRVRAYDQKGN